MILNISFSLGWIAVIIYIRNDYERTGSKALLVAEVVIAIITFAIVALSVRTAR